MMIVNFGGLGNGICVLPLLKELERVAPRVRYVHTENPAFSDGGIMSWLRLRNFAGATPAMWRRFDRHDWGDIRSFIEARGISLLVNLRNEGPQRDTGYAAFKQWMSGSDLVFCDLDQAAIAHRSVARPLLFDHLDLFVSAGFDLSRHDPRWMRRYLCDAGRERAPHGEIGFYTGSSQNAKRWRLNDWVELGERILSSDNRNVVVYGGCTGDEAALACTVAARLQNRYGTARCTLVLGLSLDELCVHMSGLGLLISNDTFPVHAGAALDIPVVGLYFATSATIWGTSGARSFSVQSPFVEVCPAFKHDAGNCTAYYGGCPAPCIDVVAAPHVHALVERALAPLPTARTATASA
jgi:glycosyl transferase family 9 (putative heptosyltransferase)